MTSERIKEIQFETAYPNSISVQQALLKVWNECQQTIEPQQKITLSYFRRVFKDFVDEKITMSRMVELLNTQIKQQEQ
jgi:hypothetical protein